MGDPTEGAGIVDTIYKAGDDILNGRTEDFAMDGFAFGLDALGFVANPLGALASAGVGWLIEQLDFLREPLDDLAGDPGAIMGVAAVWARTSRARSHGWQPTSSAPDGVRPPAGRAKPPTHTGRCQAIFPNR